MDSHEDTASRIGVENRILQEIHHHLHQAGFVTQDADRFAGLDLQGHSMLNRERLHGGGDRLDEHVELHDLPLQTDLPLVGTGQGQQITDEMAQPLCRMSWKKTVRSRTQWKVATSQFI